MKKIKSIRHWANDGEWGDAIAPETFRDGGQCPPGKNPFAPHVVPGWGIRLIIAGIILLYLSISGIAEPVPPNAQIKKPAVAGGFYPADSAELATEIDGYINQAHPQLEPKDRVVALVVPHAGIFYSGRVAGYSYNLARDIQPKTVVLVGPSHRVAFHGISIYDRGYFQTPLGLVPVDTVMARQIVSKSPDIRYFPEAFASEHNIEVQLPFLQRACPGVKIVPIIMGSQSPDEVEVLKNALIDVVNTPGTLLIASSDLSHYHPAADAEKLDRVCIDDLAALNGEKLMRDLANGKTEMCGGGPAAVVTMTAKALGADVGRILKYGDSGDVGQKDKSAVVGYVAAALVDTGDTMEEKTERPMKGDVMVLSKEQEKNLLAIARESIEYYLKSGQEKKWSNTDPQLDVPCGAFVTLKERGQLRGCIGQVQAVSPLFETVAGCAVSSAVRDPRFQPVDPDEVSELHIEISVLTPPQPVTDVEDIVVGRDGLMIQKGFNRGLLLPQVPIEWGWDREEFLQHLCQKAGLGPNEWKSGAEIWSFKALVFGEE